MSVPLHPVPFVQDGERLDPFGVQQNFDAMTANPLPQARAFHSVAQSIGSAVLTNVVFDSERWDRGTPFEQHSTTVNNFYLTSRARGLYWICGHVHFAPNGTGIRQARIRIDFAAGGTVDVAIHTHPVIAANHDSIFTLSTHYRLLPGDAVRLVVFQDSGAALDLHGNNTTSPTELMWMWVSP